MDDNPSRYNSKVCRICPSEECLLDLYHPSNAEARNVLNLFIDVEDENTTKLPKFVCEDCKHKLEDIIEFWDNCKTRNNELRAKIQHIELPIPIKIEPTEIVLIQEVIVKEEVDLNVEDSSDVFLVDFLEDQVEDTISNIPPRGRRRKTENPCNYCKNVYRLRAELIEHKNKEHLQCPVCLKSFSSHRKMARHRDSHAGDSNCPICGQHIKKCYLQDHIRQSHNNVKRNYKCEICGKEFFSQVDLKTHKETHKEPILEICDFENCGKAFKTVANLTAHKQIHATPILPTPDGGPFKCGTCNKELKNIGGLRKHERYHTNVRPFQCDQCPMQFKSKSNLDGHKISIHETERKHECHICGKRTKMKSNLTLHLKTHGNGKSNKKRRN